MVKATVFVIYILPIVLSVSLGTAVMAETLSSDDRELDFLQIGGDGYKPSYGEKINLVGLDSEISQNSNLEFSLSFSDSDYNCGDLYITIYDVTSGKQVLTQSGYLKQCFIQNDNVLPVDDTFSEFISKPGTYEIHIEIFNEKYTESISMTETLRVK